ncbi:hypothetical protein ISE1_1988 [plant metagenome]|uniref:Uncharacterized protein n=1 Tax=plant metagenome TaxID=1297885 RepID=A0A484TDY2_9ZZZZ
MALTRAFLAAKLHNPDESKALYAVAATLETQLGALLTAYFQTHAVARAAASALARE